MIQDAKITVRSCPRLLQAVRGFVRCFYQAYGVDRDKIDELVMAVDEACTNAIRHAYGGRDDAPIEIEARVDETWLELQIRDRGETAPQERVKPKPLEAPDLEELKPGGLGVGLIYQVFDDVRYCAVEPHGNCVTMRLRRPQAEGIGDGT